eukprot:g10709.t1
MPSDTDQEEFVSIEVDEVLDGLLKDEDDQGEDVPDVSDAPDNDNGGEGDQNGPPSHDPSLDVNRRKELVEVGEWCLIAPVHFGKPEDSLLRIQQNAEAELRTATARLDNLFKDAVDVSTFPPNGIHPAVAFMDHLQPGSIRLTPDPATAEEAWLAEKFAMAALHASRICIRYASKAAQKKAEDADFPVDTFIQALSGSGIDFVRYARQILILLWQYCIHNVEGAKPRPFLQVLFSGQHGFRNAITGQIAFTYARAAIVVALVKNFGNAKETLARQIAFTDGMFKHFTPQLEHFFAIGPMTKQNFTAYAKQLIHWNFHDEPDDKCQATIEKWTSYFFTFDIVACAKKVHPEQFLKPRAQHEKDAMMRDVAPVDPILLRRAERMKKAAHHDPPPRELLTNRPPPPGASNKQQVPAKGGNVPKGPNSLSATLQNHKNKQQQKDAQKGAKPNQDPRAHGVAVGAAGKGFMPVDPLAASRGASGKSMHNVLAGGATSSRAFQGLPLDPAFNGVRMFGGVQLPTIEEGNEQDDIYEEQENSTEARARRIEDLKIKRAQQKEEQQLLREFQESERQTSELRYAFTTRHPDGGRAFVNSAFSVEATYAQPVLDSHPDDLEPDFLSQLRKTRKDADEDEEEALGEFWLRVITVQAENKRVLSPMLFREILHDITKYMKERRDENRRSGDFSTPDMRHDLLHAVAIKSTAQWFFEQVDDDQADQAAEYLTTNTMSGYFRKKTFKKAVDKVAIGEKATFDKQGAFFALGSIDKTETAETYDDVVSRAVNNEGNMFDTLRLPSRPVFSEMRILTDKTLKDIKPYSFKNHRDPLQTSSKSAEKLASTYPITHVTTMLLFQNGYYQFNRDTMRDRCQDVTRRFADPTNSFTTIANTKDRQKLIFKLGDQLTHFEDKNHNVGELFTLLCVWASAVPNAKNTPASAPQNPAAAPQHPKNPKNPNKGQNQNNKGNNKGQNQQYQQNQNTWDQNQWGNPLWNSSHWNQGNGYYYQQQYHQQQQHNKQQQQQGGKGGGGQPSGQATLGVMPQIDNTIQHQNPKRPGASGVVPAPDAKLLKNLNGGKVPNATVARYKEQIQEKTGCPVSLMTNTQGLCVFYLRSLDRQRPLTLLEKEEKKAKEQARLLGIVQEWTKKRELMRQNWDDADWNARSSFRPSRQDHIDAISDHYAGYDKKYATQKLSPCFLKLVADHLGYATPKTREMIYGVTGLMDVGYGVEGELPRYGVWQQAKPLSSAEKRRLYDVRNSVEQRTIVLDRMAKWRSKPYGFEDQKTMERCYKAVEELFTGPHAERVDKSKVPQSVWVWPYFGLGQRMDPETGEWRKVRPIASERIRNNQLSPLVEHMSLPGTDYLVDMILYAMSPTLNATLLQTKDDITESILQNRKKKGGERMTWRDTSTMQKPTPKCEGVSYVPCFGKLDLYQAYLQLAARNPDRNYFQVYNPKTKKYELGKLSALSFGNVHSVFGFVGSISELLSMIINDLLATIVVVVRIFLPYCPHTHKMSHPAFALFKSHGWKLPHELKPSEYEKACGKNNNHYNGCNHKKGLEFYESFPEDTKRPRAANVVPRSISNQYKMTPENTLFIWPEEAGHFHSDSLGNRNSRWRVWLYYISFDLPRLFWLPETITSAAQYAQLRLLHPNVLWSNLQTFSSSTN